jgi:hypothetical protein
MIAAIILFSFLLAILAHIKLIMFQRSLNVMYDMLISKESVVVKTTPVYPDADPILLQQFYKLNESQRKTFYHELTGTVSLHAYNAMYGACFMKHAVERAHELQKAMLSMTFTELEAVKKLVQDVLWVPQDPPLPSQSTTMDSSVEPNMEDSKKVEAETASIPAQESNPTSAPSKAPETSTTAMIEPTNEMKIAEPTKPKTRKTSSKKVLAPEASIIADEM